MEALGRTYIGKNESAEFSVWVGGSGRKSEKFTIILRFKVWTINKTLVNK